MRYQKILLVPHGEISGKSQKELDEQGVLTIQVDNPSAVRIADVDEFKGTPIEIEVSENSFGKRCSAQQVSVVDFIEKIGER